MKMAIYAIVVLLGFVGSLAGVLAATGNLSREGLDKILGKTPPAAAEPEEEPDDLDPLLRAVREQQKKLEEREAGLKEREERVKTAEQDLAKLRDELSGMLQQYAENLDKVDADQEQKRQEVAMLLEKMKPDQAAEIIGAKEPEEAVQLLQLLPEKSRPKVMDKLAPEKAGAILDAMQNAIPALP
jgi:flagellar motility protein MotE (MotC chaperone)